ncbi:MAG: hypothetical protein WC332_00145 [Clostridia bacterium]|jgi:hypothetical protein
MELYDVVKKLVGEIKPIGETTEDGKRFENLKVMTDMVDQLLTDIDEVASGKNRYEYSIKCAGEYADKFLTRIGITE